MTAERYSHGHHESVLRSHRWRTAENSAGFLLPHLSAGMSLLDVGCGPGTITADLAGRLGDGRVVGVDLSHNVIEIAAAQYGLDRYPGLAFEVADVYALGFSDGTFDVVYAHQVLQHLSKPVEALREMRRVLKPGGTLAVRDADYGTFVWSPDEPLLDRWLALYHDITSANQAEANAGRYLKSWVGAAGFDELVVSSSNWIFESPDERTWWGGLWADRVVHSEFARQGVEYGLTTTNELEEISEAFHRWSNSLDGFFLLVNVEVLARSSTGVNPI
ncbi:MAG: methyltransferase protein [Acidimicrobiaceae bacterium]|nr:methyltransferase protein [Acidimicrobiaceae bacterium]